MVFSMHLLIGESGIRFKPRKTRLGFLFNNSVWIGCNFFFFGSVWILKKIVEITELN